MDITDHMPKSRQRAHHTPGPGSKQVKINATVELRDRLRAHCDRLGVSMPLLIEALLNQYESQR